jgi:hypothetical protein
MANVSELTMPKKKVAAESQASARSVGRPPKSTGESTQIRVDADVAAHAKILASVEGMTIADLVSNILRPILAERVKAAGRRLSGD